MACFLSLPFQCVCKLAADLDLRPPCGVGYYATTRFSSTNWQRFWVQFESSHSPNPRLPCILVQQTGRGVAAVTLPWLPTLSDGHSCCVSEQAEKKLQRLVNCQFLIRSKCALNLLSSPPNLEYEVWEGNGSALRVTKIRLWAETGRTELSLNRIHCPWMLTTVTVISHHPSTKRKSYIIYNMVEILAYNWESEKWKSRRLSWTVTRFNANACKML